LRRYLFSEQGVQERPQSLPFLGLVTIAPEDFAALDGVGDVLGHVAHFGERRPFGATGDMRVDEPGGDQPEEVEPLLFIAGGLVSGPFLSKRLLRLSERRVAFGQRGLKSGQLRLQGRGMRLEAQRLLFPTKRFAVELACLVVIMIGVRSQLFNHLVELVQIRLIDLNGSLAVENEVDDLAVTARRLSFGTPIFITEYVA